MLRYLLVMALMIFAGAAHAATPKPVQRLPVGAFEYVLYDNGSIYADNGMFRKQLDDGTGTVQLVGERNNLYILKSASEVWWYNGQKWTLVDDYEGTKRLEFVNGACVAHKTSGESYACAISKNEAGEFVASWSKVAPQGAVAAVPAAPIATVASNGSPESSSFTR